MPRAPDGARQRKETGMYARIVSGKQTPDKYEAVVRAVQEQAIPIYRGLAGFKGATLFMDRQSGAGITISLWETEANARAVDALPAATEAAAQVTRDISIT